jgi:hypothetical protein
MAVTFPFDFLATYRWQECNFRLAPSESADENIGGQTIAIEFTDPHWEADFKTVPVDRPTRAQLQAIYGILKSSRSFWGYDASRPFPIAYGSAALSLIRGSGGGAVAWPGTATLTGNSGGNLISFSGMPNGYTIKRGDYVSLAYTSGVRALHYFGEDIAASGAGVVTSAYLAPPYRVGDTLSTTAEALQFIRPKIEMLIVKDSFEAPAVATELHLPVSFKARQKIK